MSNGHEIETTRNEPLNVTDGGLTLRPNARFAFVDGLRGLAALGIAVYHIWRYEPLPYPSLQFVPSFVDWLLCRTWIGVQVLLVISGFVIAFSLRNTCLTPREAGVFLIRRVVRLTPPYWLTLLLALILNWCCVAIWNFPAMFEGPTTFWRLFDHAIYLQDVFEQPALSAGIWTICIEMQFYAVCVFGWWLAQWLAGSGQSSSSQKFGWLLLVVFGPFAALSLAHWNRLDSTEPFVTHFAGLFFLGMLTWWTLDRLISTRLFLATMGIALIIVAGTWKLEQLVALSAAMSLFAVGRVGHLHDWLHWRWLQHLAKISYSLYLIHYPLSHVLMWWGWSLCHGHPTPRQATLILSSCLIASLLAAHLFFQIVEAPTNRWSARMKKPTR